MPLPAAAERKALLIRHLSIPASAPKRVAQVRARVLGGRASAFPVYPGSSIAISGDSPSPRGLATAPHKVQSAALVALGRAAGWRASECDRSGAFRVVELWLGVYERVFRNSGG